MKNRLDEVFSVERLRRAWEGGTTSESKDGRQPPGADATERVPGAAAPEVVEASCRKLRTTIERCFPRECTSVVEPLIAEIEGLLRQRFPIDGFSRLTQKESVAITMALDGLLDRLEDLLEAFEVGAGTRS